ncbi:MAG: acyl-[acyl-carrier-protein]--UDP-N-acetylglucosamine O-acyltransferase, partial [Polynucleobacter victoriensis]
MILGGYSGVHQFCKVGMHAFLANNSAATRDVPPYVMVAGTPCEPKGINAEGLKRRGYSAAQIANIKAAYRVLYRSGLKLAEASAELARLAA